MVRTLGGEAHMSVVQRARQILIHSFRMMGMLRNSGIEHLRMKGKFMYLSAPICNTPVEGTEHVGK